MAMTPEERADFEQMKASVAALVEAENRRMLQQIDYPLDEGSVNTIGALIVQGTEAPPADETINIPSTPTNISVPASPTGVLLVRGPDGLLYKLLTTD